MTKSYSIQNQPYWLQACVHAQSVSQSCLTLCDPKDCNPPGSIVHGIFQARVLEWVAICYPRGSSQPRDQACISCGSCSGTWLLYVPSRKPHYRHAYKVSAGPHSLWRISGRISLFLQPFGGLSHSLACGSVTLVSAHLHLNMDFSVCISFVLLYSHENPGHHYYLAQKPHLN